MITYGNANIRNCRVNFILDVPKDADEIVCAHNQLSYLPTLPVGLTKLDCTDNNLTELPELPVNLKELKCDKNRIERLPKLPAGLEILWCSKNYLRILPDLPDTLIGLCCDGNPLKRLPEKMPSRMTYISITPGNKYTYLSHEWNSWHFPWHKIDNDANIKMLKQICKAKKRVKKIKFCIHLQNAIDEFRYRPSGGGYLELALKNKGVFVDL
jgi:hypothetical protein